MAIVYPSNIKYLGNKPNFTRDRFDTVAEMLEELSLGHVGEGHLSYCRETRKTYRVTPDDSGVLSWVDVFGSGEIISDTSTESVGTDLERVEKVTSEALYSLNTRIQNIESDESGLTDKMNEMYDWYDLQVHTPAYSSSISKTSSGNLRASTTATYKAVFNWSWGGRDKLSGVSIKNGSDEWITRTLETLNLEAGVENGTYTWEGISIPLTEGSSTVIKTKFITTDVDLSKGTNSVTVSTLPVSRSFTYSGLPSDWKSITSGISASETITVKATGSNLPSSAIGEVVKISTSDDNFGTISSVSDDDFTATTTRTLKVNATDTSTTSTWKNSLGTNISGVTGTSYTPIPSFAFISSTKNAWDETADSLVDLSAKGYYVYDMSAKTIIPSTAYGAGSTLIYLSPKDVRTVKVEETADGVTWSTSKAFTVSGTITFLGRTYYYRENPNIGAGTFKFRFGY